MESEAAAPGLVVALDGPASSGKSSVGAAAAARLGYRFCDTGLLYRALTWLALRRGISPDADGAADALVGLVPEVQLVDVGDGRLAGVAIDGVDETVEVHVPEVDAAVSAVSAVPALRASLLDRQRTIAAGGRLIMAGRDIGTVVLPHADLKLYLDASIEERARRRRLERGVAAQSGEAFDILTELRRRDRMDSTRAVGPLRAAAEAIVIRTDGNVLETTVDLVVAEIQKRESEVVAARAAEEEQAARAAARNGARAAAPASPLGGSPASPPGAAASGSPRGRRPPARPTRIVSDINWFRRISAGVLRLLAHLIVRLTIEGDPGLVPRSGAVIVAGNHASSADPVFIGAFLNARLGRAVNWLGKRELVEMPGIGPFMRMVPIHPVSREGADLDAFHTAVRILESGNVLAIFPEGTRSRDGALQPVRDGAGVLALHSGAPVMPVAVIDSDLMWPKGRLFPKFGKRVTVRWGRPFRIAEEIPGLASMPRRQANAAATRLIMTRIAELLPPRQRGVFAADVDAATATAPAGAPAPAPAAADAPPAASDQRPSAADTSRVSGTGRRRRTNT